jgi:hypothetical protein
VRVELLKKPQITVQTAAKNVVLVLRVEVAKPPMPVMLRRERASQPMRSMSRGRAATCSSSWCNQRDSDGVRKNG